MADMPIVNTILKQLGGNRFLVMTGAKNLTGDEKNRVLSMKLPNTKANYLRVTLESNDTYTMEFSNVRGMKVKPMEKIEGVYNDSLQMIFTRVTGLDTHL